MKNYGRLTLPTDLDVIDQTIALKEKLGADAIRTFRFGCKSLCNILYNKKR